MIWFLALSLPKYLLLNITFIFIIIRNLIPSICSILVIIRINDVCYFNALFLVILLLWLLSIVLCFCRCIHIHTYIHTYIHTHIHTYIHTCKCIHVTNCQESIVTSSRSSSQKDQWHWSRALSETQLIISPSPHHLSNSKNWTLFDSVRPSHFTPSQGFWELLSCHCRRQDSLWYLTWWQSRVLIWDQTHLLRPSSVPSSQSRRRLSRRRDQSHHHPEKESCQRSLSRSKPRTSNSRPSHQAQPLQMIQMQKHQGSKARSKLLVKKKASRESTLMKADNLLKHVLLHSTSGDPSIVVRRIVRTSSSDSDVVTGLEIWRQVAVTYDQTRVVTHLKQIMTPTE